MRCGIESPDVRTRIVDLEAEAVRDGSSIRLVTVELVTPLRHVEEKTELTVPELYGVEYRCRDSVACERRVHPERPAPAPAEGVAWR